MTAIPNRSGVGEIDIRFGRDDDSDGVIALVDQCFSAYPGCVLDLPGLDADLPRIAQNFKAQGGLFWVAEERGEIVGMIGYAPLGDDVIELKRLYVSPMKRRAGLATRLLHLVTDSALKIGARRIDLWSDARFLEAHAFYMRHGFFRPGDTRYLNDPSETTEHLFRRDLC